MKAERGQTNEQDGRRLVPCRVTAALVSPSSVIPHPSSLARLLRPSSFRTALLLLALGALLVSCGFRLRGTAALPFDSVYVQAAPASPLATELKRMVAAQTGTRIARSAAEAQVVLHILNEAREKRILALSGGGRVREFELRYRVTYRLTDSSSVIEHIPMSEIVLRRDFTYSDAEALAKESEEALLYRDMQSDAVNQLVRRLQAAKLQPAS
jgi:LPS-assembly lipoprotein